MACWNVINHTELSSANATLMDVSGISGDYDHLYIVAKMRSSKVAQKDDARFRINNDAGGNYGGSFIFSGGTGDISSYQQASTGAWQDIQITAASTLADTFSTTEIWLPDYSNSTTFKTGLIKSSATGNGSTTYYQGINVTGSHWRDTDPITQVSFYVATDTLEQYSSVTIYGINGAA
tara:strand:+ start:1929 stop:2462 length:534 start_codon:yes stop_codon:yes gene_type:complete